MSGFRFARGSIGPQAPGGDWLTIAIRARFPKLVAALGDQLFTTLLSRFTVREPDARTSLAEVHERLPEYLATAAYPAWYGEIAALDRAHIRVLQARAVPPLTRSQLTQNYQLRLVPAHAMVQLTTTADELWYALDEAAASHTRARVAFPRSLDWPRTVLVWRRHGEIQLRTVDPDEADALEATSHGASLAELAGASSHARALDLVVRWIDDGVLAG